MATQSLLQKYGQQLLFRDVTDFPNSGAGPPATAANNLIIGTPTEVQMNLSVLADGALWQSDKTLTLADTGAAWPGMWTLGACIENSAAPAADTNFKFWWNASPNSVAGTGNSGGCSGADSAYTALGTNQLIFIGQLTLRNTVVNIDTDVGTFFIPHLYGSLIIENNSAVSMSDPADNTHITLTPVIPDLQAAA